MSEADIRRSQLISPFGVGALYPAPDGQTLISAGLDHWFKSENSDKQVQDINEFKIGDWRLERWLGVDHFRAPADYRISSYGQQGVVNSYMTQPFLRFPCWYYCVRCHVLEKKPLVAIGRVWCEKCTKTNGKRSPMNQLPYVAICDGGHIQDFPWKEWVHRDVSPTCNGRLEIKFQGTGTGGSSDTRVTCNCNNTRTLGGVLGVDKESRIGRLSGLVARPRYANKDADNNNASYLCQGYMPWLGSESPSECGRELVGAIRGASNVYFAHTRSSIYVPLGKSLNDNANDLITIIDQDPFKKQTLKMLTKVLSIPVPTKQNFKGKDLGGFEELLDNYSDEDIKVAFSTVLEIEVEVSSDSIDMESFLRQEYEVFQVQRKDKDLEIRETPIHEYDPEIGKYFEKIIQVNRLRETRALIGFSRVYESNEMSPNDMKGMLRRNAPQEEWLPAHVVFGEGIFFKFSESAIASWEKKVGVTDRLNPLIQKYREFTEERQHTKGEISRRLILIHTFAHILINSLVFECGYGSASLRERLYVSDNTESPMAGVLIYTSSGDADGSMGGLVRMGTPGRIEAVIKSGISGASWCSSDPICMEIGETMGQGPDSCNLSACHSCALIAETSCELFNKLLDRGAIVGNAPVSSNNSMIGFFEDLVF